MLTSISSTSPYSLASSYNGTLPYRTFLAKDARSFGSVLEPRYIFGADPLDQ
jgi:hypothetical protein